jgi:hypothetical protein
MRVLIFNLAFFFDRIYAVVQLVEALGYKL